MRNCIFVLPAYNDEIGVVKSIHDISRVVRAGTVRSASVVVVDDGSEIPIVIDATDWGSVNVELIRCEKNQGPGAAFRSAFMHLEGRVATDDVVIMMEGDGTTPFEHLPEMLRRIDDGYGVVLGSPYLYGGGFATTSLLRRLLSEFANALTRVVLDLRGIWALSCFFRAYQGAEFLRLQSEHGLGVVRSNGFEAVVELLMRSVDGGAKICEVAIVQDQSRRVGRSKMRLGRTVAGYLRLFLRRLRMNRSTGSGSLSRG